METPDLKIDPESSDRSWLQLANQLEQTIEQGRRKLDFSLPSQSAICRTASVSHSTLFRAYRHLRQKGLVHWVKSKGFFVNEEY
jgi:DNA-binding transcriptional regulator YhcF (GntR family)